jgi:two-component sensor histidine kinase
MGIGETAATGLALAIHELATNSMKYGALSNDTGLLDISGTLVEDDIEIVWSEQGGEGARSSSSPEGYGSKLLQRTITGQLNGTIDYKWCEGGVVVTLRMKASRLSA